jgi:hypothetical protein
MKTTSIQVPFETLASFFFEKHMSNSFIVPLQDHSSIDFMDKHMKDNAF